MAARIGNIAFDCADAGALAAFWSSVLGRPVDDGAGPEFATIGGADAGRTEPALYFNQVPEGKTAKSRVHLDLFDPDPSVVDKLVRLGATVVARHRLGSHGWTVLQDPESNEFCIAAKPFES